MNLNIEDKFNKELPADPMKDNSMRQVQNACFSYVNPTKPKKPSLIHVSAEMANLLGISAKESKSAAFLNIFSGTEILKNTAPYAMCYGGHQFGNWAGQLGDGRAINLGEIKHQSKSWALQLKGAGATPYSRRADGLAVLRSSIREHLCSEAMYYLGVPTTRSLSLMLTGNEVLRDVLYNGNSAYEKGAIVCRASPNFIRFGSFEIFASRNDVDTLRKLADFTIKHFFSEIKPKTKESYIAFFKEVAKLTLAMVVHWQRVGFVHGVMNTDNMSIMGLTIDYGPYGWLEGYDPNWTPNTTDKQNRRYRFGQQPNIALWNLVRLANALFPLAPKTEAFQAVFDDFQSEYIKAYLFMMSEKLGLQNHHPSNRNIIAELEALLQITETDMTIFFRNLSNFKKEDDLTKGYDCVKIIETAFYKATEVDETILNRWKNWFILYQNYLVQHSISDIERKVKMNKVNPKYVLRNYMAQLAIDAADKGDYSIINELHELLKKPYDEQPEAEKWFAKRPEWARHKVGCSMLSCSS